MNSVSSYQQKVMSKGDEDYGVGPGSEGIFARDDTETW